MFKNPLSSFENCLLHLLRVGSRETFTFYLVNDLANVCEIFFFHHAIRALGTTGGVSTHVGSTNGLVRLSKLEMHKRLTFPVGLLSI